MSSFCSVCPRGESRLISLRSRGLLAGVALMALGLPAMMVVAQEPLVSGKLRGSTVEVSTDDTSMIRGSHYSAIVDEDGSAVYDAEPEVVRYEENADNQEGLVADAASAARHTLRSFIPVVIYRDGETVVADRAQAVPLPDHAPLRHSMLYSANVYEGLRGGSSEVGETVALALRGSYSSRAKLERAKADRARVYGALGKFLPKLTGTLDSNFTPDGSFTPIKESSGVSSVGVELSMPLFTSGVNLNTYRQAKQLSLAADYGYLVEEQRVALEAVAAHINLRLNRRIEKTLADNVRAMQRLADIASRLYEAGDASRTDIAIAQANVESARAELDLAVKSREETRNDLESITGRAAPSSLSIRDYQHLVPGNVEDAVAMALRDNPVLAASHHTALASKYAARVERGQYGPQVNLYGAYEQDVYRTQGGEKTNDWSVGVRLKVPLFDASIAPNVTAARSEALEAEYRAMDQSRLIERQVRRQWSAYHSASRRVGIVKRQVNSVAASVEGARREYEAGFRSISDVLNDQVKLARARITLESAVHEKMLAAYELAFSTAHPGINRLLDNQ